MNGSMKARSFAVLGLSLALLAVLVPAEQASAATAAVPTPVGTFYVEADADASPPNLHDHEKICVERVCIVGWWHVHDLGGAHADVHVWQESNDCEGLQREAADCDDDGTDESPDEKVEGLSPNVPP